MRIRLLNARTVFSLMLAVSLPLAAQDAIPFARATPEEVGLSSEKLDQIGDAVAEWVVNGDVIGAELLIVKDDRIVFHEAYGWSDREERRPLERGSTWSIKSMSKPFTAAAILMLEEEGKLSLDDPLLQYVPQFAGDERTTIRHLLTHTSGYEGLGDTARFPTIADWVADWAQQKPERPFGEYVYSDFNYAALGYIVEVASGVDAGEFIEERIIEPLGLDDTHTSFSPDAPWAPRVSSRYRLNQTENDYEKYWTNSNGQGWQFYPAAWGLWSTAMDYAEFLTMWIDGGSYGDVRLLDRSSVTQALAPQADIGDGWSYGYGWYVNDQLNSFGHGGFDGTHAMTYADDDAIMVFLTHSRGRPHGDALENRLGMLGVFDQPGPMAFNVVPVTGPVAEVEMSAEELSRYVGVYREPGTAKSELSNYVARVRQGERRLHLSFGEIAESTYRTYHLVPLGDHRFAMGQYRGDVLEGLDPLRTFVFDVRGDKAISVRVEKDDETMMSAPRVDPQQLEADAARILAERWRNSNRIDIDEIVLRDIDSAGIEAAREHHRQLHAAAPDSIRFDESLLNALGYRLMNQGRLPEALAVFEMNVEAYPNAANPHDSLGEAYLNADRLDEALRSYERAVELADEQDHPNREAFRARMERVRRQAER